MVNSYFGMKENDKQGSYPAQVLQSVNHNGSQGWTSVTF